MPAPNHRYPIPKRFAACLAPVVMLLSTAALPIIESSLLGFPTAAVAQTTQARKAESIRLNQEGQQLSRQGRYREALEKYQRALAIVRQIKERRGEGIILTNIGVVQHKLGNYSQALEFHQQSLAIARETGNRAIESTTLSNIGEVYRSLGEYSKALAVYQRALTIAKETNNRATEGTTLNNIGLVYLERGNYSQALTFYQQALAIFKQIGERADESIALNNIGEVYRSLAQYPKALEFYQQSLVILKEIGDRAGESVTLNNIGGTYHLLGSYPKALEFYQQALTILSKAGDRAGESIALNNIASIYYDQGNYPKALEFYQQSLAIRKKTGNHAGEGTTLGNIGNIYNKQGNYPKALEFYQQSLAVIRQLGNRDGEGIMLNNIGSIYEREGNYAKALEFYHQSLTIRRELGDRAGEGITLNNIGLIYSIPGENSELAILFLKQSVSTFESIRGELKRLSREEQQSYTESVARTYRLLASLLLQHNRIIEAIQVLDLLKVEDLQDFLKDVRGNARTAAGVEFLPEETAILQAFNSSKLPLNDRLKDATIQSQLQTLQRTAVDQNLKIKTYQDLQNRIQKLGKNVALFYPLILDDRLELVVLAKDRPPVRQPVTISREQLEEEIKSFRERLQDRSPRIKEPAQKLYQSFIQPIESELKAAGVTTLVYAPDSIMRYVPLAALHDGNQWLAQRYQINYLTALALTPLDPDPNQTPRVLAAALTQHSQVTVLGKTHNFSALQFTRPEVENLAKLLPNTKTLIDKSFNRANLSTGAAQSTILHLATHGMFVPNSPDQSIILLGDGSSITLREIEQQWKFPNVSLVVLSACETAIGGKLGSGIEIMGFGYQMQRTGSRASLSSLWTVDDGGTQVLMNAFYSGLKQGMTKAQALQEAQKALITSDYKAVGGTRSDIEIVNARTGQPIGDDKLTHPYYWAPFILIGNGL